MAKFRKKPVVIEAVRVTAADYNGSTLWNSYPFSEIPQWLRFAIIDGKVVPISPDKTDYAAGTIQWEIRTLEGAMLASPGDWIVHGVKGELYPVKPDVFTATYEAVDDASAVTSIGPWGKISSVGIL